MLKAVAGAFLLLVVSEAAFDYAKQGEWGGVCNKAESKKQSPVDVITPETSTEVEGKLFELSVSGNKKLISATNKDDEDVIKIAFSDTITYKIPGLDNVEGTVAQLHVHWGSKNTEGAEHLLDGNKFAFESHLVTSYGNDGKYAVLNRFFKVGAENNEVTKMLTSAKAKTKDDRKISNFNLTAIYPSDIKEVIIYEGSLTTPDCNEIVHWVIIPEPLTISAAQLAELRTVKLGDGSAPAKTYNFREKQALNGRTFKRIKVKSSASAAAFSAPLLLLLAVFSMTLH